ncbi:MAG: SelB C-terminal domain-containing protein, partial [Anaerolineales bacterium]
ASQVKFFIGAAESMAAVRILGADEIIPGGEAWVQLELREPVVAVRGDRYILRRPSPSETLGGGQVVDSHPKTRHKRGDPTLDERLSAMLRGTPAEVLMQACLALGAAPVREAIVRSRLDFASAAAALEELLTTGQLVALEPGALSPASDLLVMPALHWQTLRLRAAQLLSEYHQQYPLKRGMPREELKSRLKLTPRLFNALIKNLAAENALTDGGAWVCDPAHRVRFSPAQQSRVDALLAKFAAAPFATPSLREVQAEVGEDVASALIEQGELVAVSGEVLFRKTDYESMLAQVRAFIEQHGKISVAEARDLFNTSRKYILAFMEHLDAIGVTLREGDYRKLRR